MEMAIMKVFGLVLICLSCIAGMAASHNFVSAWLAEKKHRNAEIARAEIEKARILASVERGAWIEAVEEQKARIVALETKLQIEKHKNKRLEMLIKKSESERLRKEAAQDGKEK